MLLFALLLASSPAHAANVNIDALPVAGSVAGTDLLECEQGGTNRKCTAAQTAAYINSLFSGDFTAAAGGAATFATVNSNVGAFGSTTQCATITTNAKGLITAASAATCAPAIGSVTGLATNIATWLGTSNSANLRAAVTDETGTGSLYFQGGDIGTPSAGVGTNLTSLNATQLTTGTIPGARLPYNAVILNGAPSNPTGTTSASLVMSGLGVTTCRITPAVSTRVYVIFTGAITSSSAGGVTTIRIQQGTGAGPANGTAVSGTAIGNANAPSFPTANQKLLTHR